MKQSSNQRVSELRQETSNFLTEWHNSFILDYWWRKKHNIPFGSSAHREMNFIDMLIEYQEEIEIKRMRIQAMRKEEEELMGDEAENVVHMTQQEIDDEYDKLDLENLQ